MPQKFSEVLRDLADEVDEKGYIGGAIIYFMGHQYTAMIPKEKELDDPYDMTRNIAFKMEADVNSIAMEHREPSGPQTGRVQ